MQHTVYSDSDQYPIALLIKAAAFDRYEIENNYIHFLEAHNISREKLILTPLPYNEKGKAPVKFIKEQIEPILASLQSVGTKHIYCADANYFKVLTKSRKAEPHLGYSLPCAIDEYESFSVVLGVNHKSLIYNDSNEPKLTLSLQTLIDVVNKVYAGLGNDIIHSAEYPYSPEDIEKALEKLHQYSSITCDIETFSLRVEKAGIATIGFSWDEHNGIAFPVDYVPLTDQSGYEYGFYRPNPKIRKLLLDFLMSYQGTLILHNAPFDIKVLIYYLFMQEDFNNTDGLLRGLNTLTRSFEDTKVIAYLATNSCSGNSLGLKDLAHSFAGNWAQDDIVDIRKISLRILLKYNLVDALSTYWVFKQYYPRMVSEEQESIYRQLMLPSQQLITQIELTGMPLNPDQVSKVKKELVEIDEAHLDVIRKHPLVIQASKRIQSESRDKANAKLKTKQHPLTRWSDPASKHFVTFNPNSDDQVRRLFYEDMGLPVLDLTKNKQASTAGDTIKKLINHTTDPVYQELLNAFIGHVAVDKVLTAFIPNFEAAVDRGDGVIWLHGSFNLNGAVSGRLSSSGPNLQQLPTGVTGSEEKKRVGKLIKSCVQAPEGWIFCGADFNSLEDYISALTTKDPNKLKVYLEGYDGHCLRAFYYFPDRVPGIINTVESINSIKELFPEVRQDSKAPTFALTYQGTHHTLIKNLGFSRSLAQQIEANYHDLYEVSDQYVQDKLNEASERGYVELAFGLRLRTPLLQKTVPGTSRPAEAAAEGRTAGNALGQSFGLLNNRAAVEFMNRVWESPYRLDIKPVALIHDAIYLLVRDDVRIVGWVNKNLIECMQWQELPEIQHDTVKLGAELSLFWPSWKEEIVLPNNADRDQIIQIVQKARNTQ